MLICMVRHRHWHLEIGINYNFWGAFPEFQEQLRQRYGKEVSCFAALRSLQGKRRTGDHWSGLLHHGGNPQTITTAARHGNGPRHGLPGPGGRANSAGQPNTWRPPPQQRDGRTHPRDNPNLAR